MFPCIDADKEDRGIRRELWLVKLDDYVVAGCDDVGCDDVVSGSNGSLCTDSLIDAFLCTRPVVNMLLLPR